MVNDPYRTRIPSPYQNQRNDDELDEQERAMIRQTALGLAHQDAEHVVTKDPAKIVQSAKVYEDYLLGNQQEQNSQSA